jgi:flagellar motor component MotA
MMTYFTEDSMWMIFLGVAVIAVLGAVLFRTGRGYALWAMIGVAVLVVVGVTVEKLIVTEKEEVENTLDDIAAAMEANDLQKLLTYIAPSDKTSRIQATWAMDRCEIRSASILQLDVTVNRLTSPHTAQARFVGIIRYHDRKGQSPYGTHKSTFTVSFEKQGGRWIVTGYKTDLPGH